MNTNIRTPKFLSEGDTGRPKSSGAMLIQNCSMMRPLPCIVILVHGASGRILEAVGLFTSRSDLQNHGDWSHPIYENPHRIYQAYAARRLADLILDIRKNPLTQNDTINIVAHSQGTIITMLANMWVRAEGVAPADCVVLNHSPYALENRWLENAMSKPATAVRRRWQTFVR